MRNTYRWYKPSVVYGPGFINGEAMQTIGHVVSAEMRRLEDDNAAAIPEDHFLSPAEWRKHFRWPNSFTTNQCTSLMRYFIEELGPWVRRTSHTLTELMMYSLMQETLTELSQPSFQGKPARIPHC